MSHVIFFNLDFVIKCYEDIRLKDYVTNNDNSFFALNDKFNIYDFVKALWDGVNVATGHYYQFLLHTEHERPHVARIIDFTFVGKSTDYDKDIFEFDPQGLLSIAREATYSSKLDNDFSSAISIAAQAPNEIHSLEALSFKAFHKDIRNRFTTAQFDDEERIRMLEDARRDYKNKLENYFQSVMSLHYFKDRMYQSNYETWLVNTFDGKRRKKPIDPSTAKSIAKAVNTKFCLLKPLDLNQ